LQVSGFKQNAKGPAASGAPNRGLKVEFRL